VSQDEPGVFAPRERPLDGGGGGGPDVRCRFPAGAVAVVELELLPPA
jgi:hypothetical protein